MRITLILFTLFLASCSYLHEYRLPIQQGNYVTQEKVDSLSDGMTRSQVQSILGTPLVKDPFHSNRWDYVYYYNDEKGSVKENRLSVYFEGDSLTKVVGKGMPKAPSLYTPSKPGFFSRLFRWL